MVRRAPSSTLFPYTTLFRSQPVEVVGHYPCLVPRPSSLISRPPRPRSEEHTSELQSRSDLVCRLLLEKKNGDGARGLDRPAVPRARSGPRPRDAAEGTPLPTDGERRRPRERAPDAVPLRLPQGELSFHLVAGRHAAATCGRNRMGDEAARREEGGPRLLR